MLGFGPKEGDKPVDPMDNTPQPMPHTAPAPQDSGRGAWWLAALLALHLAAGLWWLAEDRHELRADEAHHLRVAGEYYRVIVSPPEGGRLAALAGMRSPYPPLPHVAGALCALVFGYSPDRITVSALLLFLGMIVGVYLLARCGWPSWDAFRAAFFFSCMPLAFGMSRVFSPDIFLAAACLWAVYALVRSDGFLRPGWSFLFALLTGLAFLSKPTAPAYLLPPAAGAALWGLGRVMSGTALPGLPPATLRRFLARLALVALLSGVLSSAWYLANRADLVTWWGTQRGTEEGLLHGSAGSFFGAFAAPPQPPRLHLEDPDLAPAGPVPDRTGAESAWRALFDRDWPVYLVLAVNGALFLPTALLAAAGALALLFHRNRNRAVLLSLLWAAGAWLALTCLFTIQNPRLLLPVLPAAALFAAMAFHLVPGCRLRRTVMIVFGAAVLFQFANLTVFGLGPLEIPVCGDRPEVRRYGDRGLVLFKPHLATGMYNAHPPRRGVSALESAFARMAARERTRDTQRRAEHAAVAVVAEDGPARLGVAFHARHHDPGVNPLRPVYLDDLSASPVPLAPAEPLQVSGPDALSAPEGGGPEYVLLWPGMEGDYAGRLEYWAMTLYAAGYDSLDHQWVPENGLLPGGWLHTLGRRIPVTPATARTLFDVDALLRAPEGAALSGEARAALEARHVELVRQYQGTGLIGRGVRLLGVHVLPLFPGWSMMHLVLLPEETPDGARAVMALGVPRQEDLEKLPPAQRGQGWCNWGFFPTPPATEWRQNRTVILSRPIMAEPLTYRLRLALQDPQTGEPDVEPLETNWIDFSALAEPR